MKKKVFATVLAAAILAVSSLSAFAAVSKTGNLTPVGDNASGVTISPMEDKEEVLANVDEDAAATIQASNNDEASSEETIANIIMQVQVTQPERAVEFTAQLTGKTFLTTFSYLETDSTVSTNASGKFEITFSLPNLTQASTNIRIVFYNPLTAQWEIVDPSSIDYENKQITVEFDNADIIFAVVADVDETADVAEGTSPRTGVASDWALYMAGAVLLFGAAGVVYSRKRA